MNVKNNSRIRGLYLFLIVLCMVFTAHVNVLNAGWLFGKLTEERKHAIKEEVQDAIRMAETLSKEKKYDEALRLLFDAMYKEDRTQLLIALDSDEKFPMVAADEIIKLEKSLIYEDQSPLMQLFRDPDFPLEEKLAYISELRVLATKWRLNREKVLFRGKYNGTLVQLMTSPRLNQGEKFDVLYWIQSTIQKEYTSAAQRNQIKKDIAQLQTLADQKLREHQYVEVFLLLSEVEQKLRDSLLYAQYTTYQQVDQSIEGYLQADESPLMTLLKNPAIPITKRKEVLAEVRFSTSLDNVPIQEKYHGPLVQIFSDPKISETIKTYILGLIVEMMKK